MLYEWDEAKRLKNIEKHGIDFADVVKVFEDFVVTRQDTRADYGEVRHVTTGLLEGREITVIHTPRDNKIRIISARRARIEERKIYHEEAEKNGDRFCSSGRDD